MTDDELKGLFEGLRQDNVAIGDEIAELRQDNGAIRGGIAELRQDNVAIRGEIAELRQDNVAIRQEAAAAHEETRRHFDVVAGDLRNDTQIASCTRRNSSPARRATLRSRLSAVRQRPGR